MNISPKILFFGTEDFSLIALRGLIEAGYDIVAVVTKPDSKKGRGQQLTKPAVKVLAEQHGIPVWQPHVLRDIENDIKLLQPVTAVLVSYGKIVPQSLIDLFTPGIINVHPSLLPKYRGPSPIESAILHGDDETGVTIMQLSAAMDAGPIYGSVRLPLTKNETRPELYDVLAKMGTDLLLNLLPNIISGELQPVAQDDAAASYCNLLQKSDAHLAPQTMTTIQAERHIRAHLGFPKSKLEVEGHDCIITKAHVSEQQNTPLDIQFKDGAFLSVDELIGPSGKTMDADSFIRGYLSR